VHIALYGKAITELRSITFHMESHSVTCHPAQVNVPAPHSVTCHPAQVNVPALPPPLLNYNQASWYSICLLQKDEWLSWPWCWL